MSKSCLGCKWIFHKDEGYSNWTVEDTGMHCVHRRNPKLPADIPDEISWHEPPMRQHNDKWHATKDGRCELYEETDRDPHKIDVDMEDIVSEEEGKRIMLEQGDPMPLLIRHYFEGDR